MDFGARRQMDGRAWSIGKGLGQKVLAVFVVLKDRMNDEFTDSLIVFPNL
tara:strand:+ start:493 stop:642 length:150 start_codon:yes stop_codon:yes gene_type:complete